MAYTSSRIDCTILSTIVQTLNNKAFQGFPEKPLLDTNFPESVFLIPAVSGFFIGRFGFVFQTNPPVALTEVKIAEHGGLFITGFCRRIVEITFYFGKKIRAG